MKHDQNEIIPAEAEIVEIEAIDELTEEPDYTVNFEIDSWETSGPLAKIIFVFRTLPVSGWTMFGGLFLILATFYTEGVFKFPLPAPVTLSIALLLFSFGLTRSVVFALAWFSSSPVSVGGKGRYR